MNEFLQSHTNRKIIGTFVVILTLFLLVETVLAAKMLFSDDNPNGMMETISVSATGEVKAVPNIATFSYSVVESGKDVAEAQNKMNEKANATIAYLKEQGIEDKDIQTTNYSANPKYDYTQGAQKQVGYEARETISVKVRDTSKSGTMLSGVGALNVSELSQLSFSTDDPTELKAQALEDAINKARTKAERIAEAAGFELGEVTSFYEENPSYGPMPYGGAMMDKAVMSNQMAVPEIQLGENAITSTVSITYKIK